MNGRQVFAGVLLGLAGVALMVVAGGAIVAGDPDAVPILIPAGVLVAVGALLVRAGSRIPAPRPVRAAGGGAWGHYVPGTAGDVGFDHQDRDHGGGWSSGGDSGGGWSSGGDSGGGWSGGGGDSGGGGGS